MTHTGKISEALCVVRQLYDAQVSLRWTWSKWSSSPPQKAGSRLSLHTHQPGRPTNDKSKLLIYSYIPWNSQFHGMKVQSLNAVHLCEPEVPQDLDCKYSVFPLALLYMRPYSALRVRRNTNLYQAKQISAFSPTYLILMTAMCLR